MPRSSCFGLEIWQAILVTVLASLLWIFPGIVAVSGPSAGTSGSVISRAMFGVNGNRLMTGLTAWLLSAVFLALNWLASSFTGARLLALMGFDDPFWAPILVTIVVSTLTVAVAVFGHTLILRSYTIITVALLIVFILATVVICS